MSFSIRLENLSTMNINLVLKIRIFFLCLCQTLASCKSISSTKFTRCILFLHCSLINFVNSLITLKFSCLFKSWSPMFLIVSSPSYQSTKGSLFKIDIQTFIMIFNKTLSLFTAKKLAVSFSGRYNTRISVCTCALHLELTL